MPMTGSVRPDSGSIRRWRRWSAEEKARIVQETYARGCRCRWWRVRRGSRRTRCLPGGGCTSRGRCRRSVPTRRSGSVRYRALQHQVRELLRLLGTKTLRRTAYAGRSRSHDHHLPVARGGRFGGCFAGSVEEGCPGEVREVRSCKVNRRSFDFVVPKSEQLRSG